MDSGAGPLWSETTDIITVTVISKKHLRCNDFLGLVGVCSSKDGKKQMLHCFLNGNINKTTPSCGSQNNAPTLEFTFEFKNFQHHFPYPIPRLTFGSLPCVGMDGSLRCMAYKRKLQPRGCGLEFFEQVREGDSDDESILSGDVHVDHKILAGYRMEEEVEIATCQSQGL